MEMRLTSHTHLIDRTSPKGPGMKFIGRCRWCGKEGLGPAACLEVCEVASKHAITQSDSLLAAIDENLYRAPE